MQPTSIKINCNTGNVSTNQMGSYGKIIVWYLPNRIANIFSMHELEKSYQSWEGFYVIYTPL
jgi:hypothetical protein